ncbi:MAG: FAD-dependent oxidoreductase [Clostridia bacterium]|jgi:glutamate synthase (NADPH/NADH) small chain|nr:FAD-dependent oxidoreductase [Clostridia bacterium]
MEEEILEKANYCLKCKTKPCSKACPMHTNIPEFITEISKGEYEKAYKILRENNMFTHICSIVCPQEEQCEGSCVRGIKQSPTQIGKLEKFVNEWAEKNNIKYISEIKKQKNKRIAVIGSGPAGLQAAYDLRKEGFEVTIFEKEKKLGGILNYGIPDFRLEKEYVNNIIEELKQLGVKFETEKELGKNIHIKELLKKYDSIFLGIGAEMPSQYNLGEFDKIYDSDYFLKAYNSNNFIKDLGNVVVIGGGNVAMDSARAAVKMGATTSNVLYRRDEEHMPARKIELQEAVEDGVNPEFKTRVIKAEGTNRKIEKVKCIKTEVIDGKAIDMPNTEFDFKADSVVFAIGLKPNKEILEKEGLQYNDNGLISIDENGKTNIDNVYAGGDLAESKSTVCRALGSARKAAKSIIENLEKGEQHV